MGRGRQKAKATRQAREMKYFSPQTDYSALQRELRQSGNSGPAVAPYQDDFAEGDDYSEDSGYDSDDDYR
ncbi:MULTISPECIES: DUF3073 domain-containing protein [Kocuria]|uniref:DUF3073 domain-containing protein n=1 Tax=Kocuria subflava TaxID=1736139 RepID=A0A846THH9_9MICC|nr:MULTISPECIES: DUF3073 domain-containing protein [Kocuria]NKE08608.1 DUF3073 domain-containing protein [Kocuria subflava]